MDDEDHKMRKLIVIKGLPGSGKNFLVDRIIDSEICNPVCKQKDIGTYKENISWQILSTDDLFEINGKYYWNPEYLGLFHKTNLARAKLAINNGIELVIINNTNTTFKEFSDYVEHAILHDYEVEIREPETWWRYNVEECFEQNVHGVTKEVIQKMLERWESTESCYRKIEELKELYAKGS